VLVVSVGQAIHSGMDQGITIELVNKKQGWNSHLFFLSLHLFVAENWAMVMADPNCACGPIYYQQHGWVSHILIKK